MEAVGPGVECGDEGASLQRALAGAWPFCAGPAAQGALAVGRECVWGGEAVATAGQPLPTWLVPKEAGYSPTPAGGLCALPRGIDHTVEPARALGNGHAAVVLGQVIEDGA